MDMGMTVPIGPMLCRPFPNVGCEGGGGIVGRYCAFIPAKRALTCSSQTVAAATHWSCSARAFFRIRCSCRTIPCSLCHLAFSRAASLRSASTRRHSSSRSRSMMACARSSSRRSTWATARMRAWRFTSNWASILVTRSWWPCCDWVHSISFFSMSRRLASKRFLSRSSSSCMAGTSFRAWAIMVRSLTSTSSSSSHCFLVASSFFSRTAIASANSRCCSSKASRSLSKSLFSFCKAASAA
mmetsp:Transcript_147282/g.257320  ORF Transcript_147282/g.257320 Transcript_147282/m.257320 type:complete len:241 (-) Transcript_147282:1770-2492(-)